jgi:NAD(P)-dependent dehydrogenase (short-subunit alcohol dehydrogenase family)
MPTVLVTGSSSGFGELTSRLLATRGYRVYASMRGVSGRNAEAAERLMQWAASQSADLVVTELDLTSDTSVRAALEPIVRSPHGLDVVVNNAAGNSRGPLEAFSIDQMAALLDVNVLGPMRVNKLVLPSMRARGSGLIIWVTSTLGRVLPASGGLYPATKWAAEGFAESLHHQVAPFGVEVAILEPGSFPTPIHGKAITPDDESVVAAYATLPTPPRGSANGNPSAPPDPGEVAEAVLRLIELPAGSRPLRTVVGPVFTEGVAEYNATYEQLCRDMAETLRRPDQSTTWASRSR